MGTSSHLDWFGYSGQEVRRPFVKTLLPHPFDVLQKRCSYLANQTLESFSSYFGR